jgi:hypothetical protein
MTDPETTERMLRGEPTGPPHLAALLAAASADLDTEDLGGEEAAVAAFRAAPPVRTAPLVRTTPPVRAAPSVRTAPPLRTAPPVRAPRRETRRPFLLGGVKAALLGLLLLGGGVTAVATTSTHLPLKHSHSSPATHRATVKPRTSPRPTPKPPRPRHPVKTRAKHSKGRHHAPPHKKKHTPRGRSVTHKPARTVPR